VPEKEGHGHPDRKSRNTRGGRGPLWLPKSTQKGAAPSQAQMPGETRNQGGTKTTGPRYSLTKVGGKTNKKKRGVR